MSFDKLGESFDRALRAVAGGTASPEEVQEVIEAGEWNDKPTLGLPWHDWLARSDAAEHRIPVIEPPKIEAGDPIRLFGITGHVVGHVVGIDGRDVQVQLLPGPHEESVKLALRHGAQVSHVAGVHVLGAGMGPEDGK